MKSQYRGLVTHRAARVAASRALASMGRQAIASKRRSRYGPGAGGAIARYQSRAYRTRAVECKTVDYQFTGAHAATYTPDTQPFQQLNTSSDASSVQCVNLCQQGVGIGQRDGNKISLKSLRLRMSLNLGNAVNNTSIQNVRLMLVYDHQPNGAYPAMTTILADSLQANTIQNGNWASSLNPNNFERFRILMDKYITMPPVVVGAITGQSVIGPTSAKETFQVDEFINLKDLETLFNQTSNPMTIAGLTTGALFLCSFGDFADASCPWTWKGTVRLRFHDN